MDSRSAKIFFYRSFRFFLFNFWSGYLLDWWPLNTIIKVTWIDKLSNDLLDFVEKPPLKLSDGEEK